MISNPEDVGLLVRSGFRMNSGQFRIEFRIIQD